MKKSRFLFVLLISLVMTCTAFPMTAMAGGGMTIHYYVGSTYDATTAWPGAVLKVKMNDLGSEFESMYKDGDASVTCTTYSAQDFTKSLKEYDFTYDSSAKEFTCKIPEANAGRYYVIYTGADDSYYNNNTGFIHVDGKANIGGGPSITGVEYSNAGITRKTITVRFSGNGAYSWQAEPGTPTHYANKASVKIWSGGTLVATKTGEAGANYVSVPNVPVKYNADTSIDVQIGFPVAGNIVWSNGTKNYTVKGGVLGKNKVSVTRINSSRAVVHWDGIAGAGGYYIYKNGKKIKTVGSAARKYTVKKSKAGKAKYKVIPYIKADGKTYKGTSNVTTPKTNHCTWGFSTDYNSLPYGECRFVVKKIKLSGSTYTITGYAVNNRIFKMKKFGSLTLKVKCGSTVVASKTWKNLSVNCPARGSRRMVLKIKGKSGKDIRWSGGFSVSEKPYWETVGYSKID